MIILEGFSFLDSHWLSTILETVFTIFIFLLGVPLLFTHVFMPEELRELYNRKFQKDHVKRITIFIIWVILFTTVFANHFIKNLGESYFTNLRKSEFLVSFNIITLVLFIIYCWRVLRYAHSIIYKKETFITELLNKIQAEIQTKESISDEAVMDLQTICGTTKTPNSRKSFLEGIKSIINSYLASPNYKGEELEELTSKVLSEGIIENTSFHNERDLKEVFELNDRIISRYNNDIMEVDCRAAKNCLVVIGNLCLKNRKRELFSYCLSSIFKAPNSFDQVRNLCRLSFDAGHRGHVALKANKYLKRAFFTSSLIEKNGSLRNSLAFFSWLFNDENKQVKRYVFEKLQFAINNKKLNKEAFDTIMKSFYLSNDFFTANCIDLLSNKLFTSK